MGSWYGLATIMIIIETLEELDKVKSVAAGKTIAAIPFYIDHKLHPMLNEYSVIAMKIDEEIYILPFNHNECISLPHEQHIFQNWDYKFVKVPNKKKCWISVNCKIIDVEGLEYFATGNITSESTFYTPLMKRMYSRYHDRRNVNTAIPIMDLEKYFSAYFAHMEPFEYELAVDNDAFHNNVVLGFTSRLEGNGLHVDPEQFKKHFPSAHISSENMIYTEYNPYTTTGRITNKFDGVNYAGLNSQDDTRQAFTSRYGDDGILINIDYKSFHPLIIADLIGYSFPDPKKVYEFLYNILGQSYFGDPPPATPSQIKLVKTTVMQCMYGETLQTNVEFFLKLYAYRNMLWKDIQQNGFIVSPKGRKIHLSRIEKPTAAKLLSYLIQLREMEITVDRMSKFSCSCTDYVVLYTYDSLLLDVPHAKKDQVIGNVNILTDGGKYPVRVYTGKNYGEMTEYF